MYLVFCHFPSCLIDSVVTEQVGVVITLHTGSAQLMKGFGSANLYLSEILYV
jgi:hypothetical protein